MSRRLRRGARSRSAVRSTAELREHPEVRDDFADLRFAASSGRLFRDGWLLLDPDVLAPLDRETTIEATYRCR